MRNKHPLQQRMSRQKWFQLGFALVLALILLFIPLTLGTVIRISVPATTNRSADQAINLSLPFGPALVYATGGLTITKSAPDVTDPGAILTYTLTITNNSGSPIEGLGEDPLPTGVGCRSGDWLISAPAGWNPTCISNHVFWEIPASNPLPDGDSVEIIFTVQVSESLPDGYEIVNENYQVSETDYFPWDVGPPVTTTVRAPGWAIVKTVSSPAAEPNDILVYTITATNVGQLATSGLYTITDSLPNDVSPLDGPDPLIWSFSDPLNPLDTKAVTYSVRVDSPLATGTEIVNSGYTVSGGGALNPAVNDPVTTTVVSTATLSIAKVGLPDPVQIGQSLVYTLTVTNDAAAAGPAANLVITDTLPSEVSYQSAGFVGSAGGTVSRPDPSTVVWQITNPNPLPVGQSVQVTAAVTVNNILLPNPPLITNTYQAAADNAPLVSGAPLGTQLAPGDPDSVTVVAGSTGLNVCQSTIVTATVFDASNNPIPGIPLEMYVDNQQPFPPSLPLGDAIITSTTALTSNAKGQINAYVQGTAAGNVSVGAYVLPASLLFGQTGNITFNDPPVPTDITVTVAPSLISIGSTATITAYVQNCLGAMSGQLVTFNMPAEFGSINPPTATTNAGGLVTATVTAGTTVGTTSITGSVGSLSDVAALQIAVPVLTITKSATPAHLAEVRPADTLTYTLRVTNSGQVDATGLVLTDTLPAGVGYVDLISSTTGSGVFAGPTFPPGNQVVLSITKLEPDQVLQATLSVTVTATISGTTLNNEAEVKSSQTDRLTSNIVTHTVITSTLVTGNNVYLPIVLKDQN